MAELNSTPEKSGRKGSSRRAIPRVDLTAMVDLAFLLITFFMLTTILTKPKWMPVVMPAVRSLRCPLSEDFVFGLAMSVVYNYSNEMKEKITKPGQAPGFLLVKNKS